MQVGTLYSLVLASCSGTNLIMSRQMRDFRREGGCYSGDCFCRFDSQPRIFNDFRFIKPCSFGIFSLLAVKKGEEEGE